MVNGKWFIVLNFSTNRIRIGIKVSGLLCHNKYIGIYYTETFRVHGVQCAIKACAHKNLQQAIIQQKLQKVISVP